MEKKESTWLEFKLQSLRYGMYTRRLPLLLLLNVVLVIIIGSLVLYLVEEGTNPAIHDYVGRRLVHVREHGHHRLR